MKNSMTSKELNKFLDDFGYNVEEFSNLVGVTRPAVDHWLAERRPIPLTVVKLLKFFRKHPTMVEKFDAAV